MPKVLPIVQELVLGDRDALAVLDVNIINDSLSLELDQDFPFDALLPADTPLSSYGSVIAEQLVDKLNQLQLSFVQTALAPGSGVNQILNPQAVATYPNGIVLICDSGNHRLQLFNDEFDLIAAWGSAGGGNGQFANGVGPVDAAIESGSLLIWALDPGNHRLQRFEVDGNFLDSGLYQRRLSVFANAWGSTGAANGQFDDPRQLAVNSLQRVYVTDLNNDRIQRFSSAGVFQLALTGWTSPRGIAIDSSDNLYIGDGDLGGSLYKLDSAHGPLWTVGAPGIWQVATNTVDVWATDRTNNRLYTFDSDGFDLGTIGNGGTEAGEFDTPTGICYNAWNGRFYVVDSGNARVQAFTNGGSFDFEFSVGANPYAITANPANGSLFVTDIGDNIVREYSPRGVLIRQLYGSGTGNGQTTEATGIALNPAGTALYLVDSPGANPNRVQRFTEQVVTGASSDGGCFDDPRCITNGETFGRIFIADPGNARIQIFDYLGALQAIIPLVGTPLAMAAAPAGNEVYLLMDDRVVTRITVAGDIISSWGQSGTERLHDPRGITVHPGTGHVVLFDVDPLRGNVLKEFSPEGVLLQVYGRTGTGNGEFTDPVDLAFFDEAVIGDGNNLYTLENSRLQHFSVATRDLTRYDIAVPGWERLQLDAKRPHLVDDFLPIVTTSSLIGQLGWEFTTSGFGSITSVASERQHPGIMRLSTLNSPGAMVQLALPETCTFASLDRLRFVMRIPTFSSVAIFAGFVNSTTNEGISFQTLSDTSGLWNVVANDGGSSIFHQLWPGAVSAGTWYRLEITRLDDNSVRAAIYNSVGLIGRLLLGGLDFGAAALRPVLLVQTFANATRTLDIDWFDMQLRQART